MSRQRIEIIDGREYVVTTLPQDKRLSPSKTRKRQLFAALPSGTKNALIRASFRKSRRRRRKRG